MNFRESPIHGVVLVEPQVFGDNRGFFLETWHAEKFAAAGIDAAFLQDNHSRSSQWTLRGLHLQVAHTQGKLVRVASGSVFDVVVDLAAQFAELRCLVGSGALGRESPHAVGPARLGAWHSRHLAERGFPLQMHRLLQPRG